MDKQHYTDEELVRRWLKRFYSQDLSLREAAEGHDGITYQDVRQWLQWDELDREELTKPKRRAVKKALGLPVTEPGSAPASADSADEGGEG